jgi:hypothetical protein
MDPSQVSDGSPPWGLAAANHASEPAVVLVDRPEPAAAPQLFPSLPPAPIAGSAMNGETPNPIGVGPAVSVSPGVAVRRHWILALLPIVALVGAAVAIGVQRVPLQSAQTRLIVGTIDVKAVAVPGYVTATVQLASTYSRLGVSQAVMGPAAQQAGVSEQRLLNDVLISPIPQDAFVSVTAHNVSPSRAIAESNAVATSLQSYVASLSSSYYSPAAIASRYHNAAATLERYNGKIALLQARIALETTATAQRVTEAKIVAASRRADGARLKFNGYAAAYNALLQDNRQPQGLKVVGGAVITGNDRRTFLERGVAAAVVVGAILGLAVATLRERRVVRRRRAAAQP